jgi:very-short-patch-repair endonuclease
VRFDHGHPRQTVLHWHNRPGAVNRPIVGLRQCLIAVMDCLPADLAIAVLDSALALGFISLSQLRDLGASGSHRHRGLIAKTDGRAASGLESVSRVRLRALGFTVAVQVEVLPGIRVDLLIDGWLVIELDGEQFHGNAVGFERDRERDAPVNAWGYRVLHFSRNQVVDDWATVQSTVLLVHLHGRPMPPQFLT